MSNDCPHGPGALFRDGPLKGLRKWSYKVLYADPPWQYVTYSDKGQDRGAVQHYDVMTLDEIKAMPVKDLVERDAVLFMWVTDTHLRQAFEVLDAWGFEYKTVAFYWVKQKKSSPQQEDDSEPPAEGDDFFGMGKWTRANPEQCLLATRGKPKRLSGAVRKLLTAPVREHSRKPDQTYGRIEKLVEGPYAELFSRTTAPGWDCAGNEVGKFNPLDPIELEEIDALI